MNTAHTQKCLAEQQAAMNEINAYTLRWPYYCRDCGGSGIISWLGTYYEPPGEDLCSCVYDGRCPRCAQPLPNELMLDGDRVYKSDPALHLSGRVYCLICDWVEGQTQPFPDYWEGFCGCHDDAA